MFKMEGPVESLNQFPSIDSVIGSLRKCRDEQDVQNASQSYLRMCEWGVETHKILGNFLVPTLASCGRACVAQQVFRKLGYRTEHSWTSLIQEHAESEEWQNALDLYQGMLDSGVCPSKFTYVALLKACARMRYAAKGQTLHLGITKMGLDDDHLLGNGLVDMYSKCGLLTESKQVFTELQNPDVLSWAALATGYLYNGFPDEVLKCFNLMQRSGVSPNVVMYTCGLKACSWLGTIGTGYLLHSEISVNGYESVPSVASALVGMYAKCGSLLQAQDVFSESYPQDITLWNSLLLGLVEHGHAEKALECCEVMMQAGVSSDSATFVGILKACSIIGAVQSGQMVHFNCCLKGLEADPYVSSCLVEMYLTCGLLSEAKQVFDELPIHDVVLWTGLIAGYVAHGYKEKALDSLEEMQDQGVSPNSVTLACSLKACCSIEFRYKGQEIHMEIIKKGFERDTVVFGNLMELYVKCGLLLEAQALFKEPQDVVSWNIVIAGCVEHELYEEGIKYFHDMQREKITPTAGTYVSMIKAISCIRDLQAGHKLHIDITKQGMERETFISNILVDMYVNCDSLVEAEDVFDKLSVKDVVSWTALVRGYVNYGLENMSLDYMERMKSEGVCPDLVAFVCSLQACSNTNNIDKGYQIHLEMAKCGIDMDKLAGNSLVAMYIKFGLLTEAHRVFEKVLMRDEISWNTLIRGYVEHGLTENARDCLQQMQKEGLYPNAFSWSILIHNYVEQEEVDEAFQMYAQMQEQGILPDVSIFSSVLASCGTGAALQFGKSLHSQIDKQWVVDAAEINIATSLIDMYSRCGNMKDAQHVFDALVEKDLVAWNSLSLGYARQGESGIVFSLYTRMQEEGLLADEITCLSLLSVCRHEGLVVEGQEFFYTMRKDLGIAPNIKHYSCTIDLLGCAGRLDEIVPLMEEMPFEPNLVTWHIIMSACQRHGDLQLGRKAFACARSLGEKHSGTYVFMSNIFVDVMLKVKTT